MQDETDRRERNLAATVRNAASRIRALGQGPNRPDLLRLEIQREQRIGAPDQVIAAVGRATEPQRQRPPAPAAAALRRDCGRGGGDIPLRVGRADAVALNQRLGRALGRAVAQQPLPDHQAGGIELVQSPGLLVEQHPAVGEGRQGVTTR